MLAQPFIKGLELAQLFYEEAIGPLMTRHFPNLPYAFARLGSGSDVLGFDTPQSRDHGWGPEGRLFLAEADLPIYKEKVDEMLRRELPPEIRGYPTNYGRHEDGSANMEPVTGPPINHRVTIQSINDFFREYLAYDASRAPTVTEWLTFPAQHLHTITAGRVFHDDLNRLAAIRRRLSYYPHDVWLYLLAGQWRRISQEDVFVSRTGDVGDDLGSRIIAGRIVHDLMNLCFLMEKQYAPYPKWFGTGFARLACAPRLTPIFRQVFDAPDWRQREKALCAAYSIAAEMHNALAVTPPLPTEVSPFHDRPYLVLQCERFVEVLMAAITDEAVLALPAHLGGVEQFVNSTDVLSNPPEFARLRHMYLREERP